MTVGYLFDLDRTLVTYDPEVAGIFRKACDAADCRPTDECREAFRSGYVETLSAFEGDPYVGAARQAVEAGLETDPERLASAYVEAELAATEVPAGVPELLADLSPVGVVTNGYGPVQRRKLDETGLEADVDAVVAADDVGAFKPDPAPFDAVTDRLAADEYVMVGDSVTYDVAPAADRGYLTVLVGESDASGEGHAVADHRLSAPDDLSTLPDLLEG